jgi:hypothetical protein
MYSSRAKSETILDTLVATLLFGPIAAAQPAANTSAPTLAINDLSPATATPGSSVFITGDCFTGASQVAFSGHKAAFQVDSATRITAIVPLAATTGPIEVATPSGTVTSSQSFQVIARTWDAVQDFSTASNPTSAWSYGWASSLGGTFQLLTSNQACPGTGIDCWQNGLQYPDTASVAKNSTPYDIYYISVVVPTNALWLGAQANSVIVRWTAPTPGDYSIIGRFQGIDTYLSPVNIAILQNGATLLWTDSFTFYGEAKSFALSKLPLAVKATIDFELAYTTDAGSDNVSLNAAVNLLQ